MIVWYGTYGTGASFSLLIHLYIYSWVTPFSEEIYAWEIRSKKNLLPKGRYILLVLQCLLSFWFFVEKGTAWCTENFHSDLASFLRKTIYFSENVLNDACLCTPYNIFAFVFCWFSSIPKISYQRQPLTSHRVGVIRILVRKRTWAVSNQRHQSLFIYSPQRISLQFTALQSISLSISQKILTFHCIWLPFI